MQEDRANSMGCPIPRSVAMDRDASTSASRGPELLESVDDMSMLLYNALRRFVAFFVSLAVRKAAAFAFRRACPWYDQEWQILKYSKFFFILPRCFPQYLLKIRNEMLLVAVAQVI